MAPNHEPTREDDEELLAIMRALEDAGVEVITDADMPTMLSDLLADEFEQAAAERAWTRSKWDGRL